MKVQELATLMTRRFDDVDHRLERVETGLVTMNGAMTSVRADLTLLRRDVQMLDGRM